jgi:hypothetical protein
MGLDRAFHAAATYASPPDLNDFRKRIDPAWVDAALVATGTATIRRRRLPAEQVIWIVLGMGLFRDRTIEDVVSKLDLALPGGGGTIAKSSVSQARERVGSEPVKWLFERSAQVWASRSAEAHRWRGLTIFGIDGTTVRVPDSPENRITFGGQSGRKDSESGYPMLRLVALMVLRSHLLAACNVVGYGKVGERRAADALLPSIPERSLTIVDRGFFAAPFLLDIEAGEDREWLTRARTDLASRVVQRFGRGDELIELDVTREARRDHPDLPGTWQMRAIKYKRKGFKEQTLLTSLRDPKRFPAEEVIALYHERWELELGYDEIKTELLEREETIRSRKPDGVLQEVWGILLAYNLVRLEMESLAKEARIEPTRISFIEALRLIRDEWEWLSVTSPGAIPKRLETMRRNLKRYVLPPRRPRRFPRVVKIKMSNYERKRPLAERAK